MLPAQFDTTITKATVFKGYFPVAPIIRCMNIPKVA